MHNNENDNNEQEDKSHHYDKDDNASVVLQRQVEQLLNWPTDTFSIDLHFNSNNNNKKKQNNDNIATEVPVHTVILFVPGNPGLCEWYIPMFASMLSALGPGFAVRGASHAGHSVDPQQIHVEEEYNDNYDDDDENTKEDTTTTTAKTTKNEAQVPPKTIAWTIDGQVHHKLAYMDKLCQEEFPHTKTLSWILVGHSIGCHLVQRMLVLRSHDIAVRTRSVIYLMPFVRMDAPLWPHQTLLDWVAAANPDHSAAILQSVLRLLAGFPQCKARILQSIMDRPKDRVYTARLLRQLRFPRNFLGLGLEEIRDVPQTMDVPALRHICNVCGIPLTILCAGNDHWSPEFHMRDLQSLQVRGILPLDNFCIRYMPQLKHDFITLQTQTAVVEDFCIDWIRKTTATHAGRDTSTMFYSKL